jgi:hypothetical protein
MRSHRLFKKLIKAVESEAASAIPRNIEKTAALYRKLQDTLETSLLPQGHMRAPVEARKGAQSKQFMMQILPHIQRYLRQFPAGGDVAPDGPSFITGLCSPCGPLWTGLQTRSG